MDHIPANGVGRYDMDMPFAFFLFGETFFEIIGQRANLVRVGNKLTAALGERDGVIYALK